MKIGTYTLYGKVTVFFIQELKFFSEILKTSKQYSCSEGEKEVNRKKNRYKDILPCKCLVFFK
jgi:protein tyrosine phosphatase